jgi:RNA recognition motif-containing protein
MAQKLYIGNLPFTTTEDELRQLFGQHGNVESAQIITDRDTGQPRGFAFIEMDNADAAIAALDNHSLGGRTLKVNIAKAKTSGGSGGGGRSRW